MAAKEEEPLYTISIVAKRLGVHPQTLRKYEREGFLKPSRTEGNTRLYSETDLGRLRTVLRLNRELGVNLAGVEVILEMIGRVEAIQEEMAEKEQEFNRILKYLFLEMAREYSGSAEKFKKALIRAPGRGLVKIERLEEIDE